MSWETGGTEFREPQKSQKSFQIKLYANIKDLVLWRVWLVVTQETQGSCGFKY